MRIIFKDNKGTNANDFSLFPSLPFASTNSFTILLVFFQERDVGRLKHEFDELRASTSNTERLFQVKKDRLVFCNIEKYFGSHK
jgi:hypothetical protein